MNKSVYRILYKVTDKVQKTLTQEIVKEVIVNGQDEESLTKGVCIMLAKQLTDRDFVEEIISEVRKVTDQYKVVINVQR